MWVKDKNSMESYFHVCEGWTLQRMKRHHKLKIKKHDVQTNALTHDEQGRVIFEYIEYCPYCGAYLQD